MTDLKDIFEQFKAEGTFSNAEPYGSGHIHDTFRVETREADTHNYILQRLNSTIFKDIEGLQNNISLVTSHIKAKLSEDATDEIDRKVLQLILTLDGLNYYTDKSGKYWRLYIFISNHISYDIVENTLQAKEGGKAIGKFQAQLADLDSIQLNETIPFFHNIEKRLESFSKVVESDTMSRARETEKEIKFVVDRAKEMGIILKLGKEGKIPLRTTHNDTKFNNVLLDKENKALCVIDLDTVMPGYVHYDFGDAIRTAANSGAEDEKDLEKIYLRMDLFEAYADGYLSEICNTLTQTELDYLAFAPRLITYTIGLRFLTDYLDGDNYFKIHRDGHNLDRARAQFKLVESNEENYEEMKKIIDKLVKRYRVTLRQAQGPVTS